METAVSAKDRSLLALFGSVLGASLAIYFLIFAPANDLKEQKTLLETRQNEQSDLVIRLNNLASLTTTQTPENSVAEKTIRKDLFEFLAPVRNTTSYEIGKLEIGQGASRGTSRFLPFSIEVQAEYERICEYLAYLEQERPAIFVNQLNLGASPRQSQDLLLNISGLVQTISATN